MSPENEDILVQLAKDVDGSYPRLWSMYTDRLYADVVQKILNKEDARDIIQDVFERVYRHLKSYPPERILKLQLDAWLYKITKNACLKRKIYMLHEKILQTVTTVMIDALGVDEDEVAPEATLLGDLGAESIDLLDILFRLERKLGIKIQASDITVHIQGGIPDEVFCDENHIISAVGLAQLKKAMPQINTDVLAGKLQAEKVLSLFTVGNLVNMYDAKASV